MRSIERNEDDVPVKQIVRPVPGNFKPLPRTFHEEPRAAVSALHNCPSGSPSLEHDVCVVDNEINQGIPLWTFARWRTKRTVDRLLYSAYKLVSGPWFLGSVWCLWSARLDEWGLCVFGFKSWWWWVRNWAQNICKKSKANSEVWARATEDKLFNDQLFMQYIEITRDSVTALVTNANETRKLLAESQ